MGMDRAVAPARAVPAEASGSEVGLTLAALIDVLDRADEARDRTRPRRAARHRPASARAVADRWDPLRDLDTRTWSSASRAGGTAQAMMPSTGTHRSVPRVVQARVVPLRSVPPAPPARWPVVPAPAPAVAAGRTAPAQRSAGRAGTPFGSRLRAVLTAVARRAALWGAGPGGTHLAWNAPEPPRVHRGGPTGPPAVPRRVDPPVVLRELPSTPTAPPAPRTARVTVPPAAAAPRPAARRASVRSPRTPALSTVRRIPPLPPAHATVPSRARSPGGVRGSPGSGSARGSPPPPRGS